MSAQKQITMSNGVSGNFICRIESVTVRNKPDSARLSIVNYAWYANSAQKAASNPIESTSCDLPVDAFLGADNPIDVAYEELQKPGMMLEGSTKV